MTNTLTNALHFLSAGVVHFYKDELEVALHCFTKALEMCHRLHSNEDYDTIAHTLKWIGKMKYSRQRYLTKQIKVIIVRQKDSINHKCLANLPKRFFCDHLK